MLKKVIKTIADYSMIDRGDSVIVAVSGGPDSMCLLDMLCKLREKLNIKVSAAHINHCLRGEEADKDELYVEQFCKKHEVDFYSLKADVHKIAEEKAISCEMAGREVRYKFFEELKEKINAQKIALAHNANDLAETILMRIMRGTGSEGIIGIKPVRDYIYIRPILYCTRTEIEEYCCENELGARIDKTNLESIYARNKVRLELIPYMQENFNKDIIATLNRLADTMKVDNEFLEIKTEEAYEEHCVKRDAAVMIKSGVFKEHHAILTRVIRKALSSLSGSSYNFEKVHIYDVIKIQKGISGKKINLPKNILAINEYGNVKLAIGDAVELQKDIREYTLKVNEENIFPSKNDAFILELKDRDTINNIKGNRFVKYFDYDKIHKAIYFRYRRDGDKIVPIGMSGSKKLKKVFNDCKVPAEKRDEVPIVCFGSEIAWVVGCKVSDMFKIDNKSKKILCIKYKGEN